MCTVVNKYKSAYDVYIGRGSIWGNPFIAATRSEVDRAIVIAKHKQYLWNQIKKSEITIDQLKALHGKRLGCFCKPKTCHGDNIVAAVEWAMKQ